MWEYFKKLFVASAQERDVKEDMRWYGYTDEQIENMTPENIALFEEYSLTRKEKATLTQEGKDETSLKRITAKMLTLGHMNVNPEDEGCGISPMPRAKILNLALRDFEPVQINNPADFKKVFKLPSQTTHEAPIIDEKIETLILGMNS